MATLIRVTAAKFMVEEEVIAPSIRVTATKFMVEEKAVAPSIRTTAAKIMVEYLDSDNLFSLIDTLDDVTLVAALTNASAPPTPLSTKKNQQVKRWLGPQM